MKYTLKAFGITREILGGREVSIEVDGDKVVHLKETLLKLYPEMKSLNSLFIAVNNDYANDETRIIETDEIALIPPVSGG